MRRLILTVLVSLGILGNLGCMCSLNTIPPPCPERKRGCETLAGCARRQVYIFIMDGLDPCDTANLEGLRDYFCQIGFYKVWLGHFYHVGEMEREILCRFRCDPDAKFVLIGHGTGAGKMHELAQRVHEPGVNIDLLVYLNPLGLGHEDSSRPENALQVLNFGSKWCRPDINGAENLHVPEVCHFGLPSYWCVVDRIVEEVARIASQIPVVETEDNTPIFPPEPTPRPVAQQSSDTRDEWDFLKPGTLHWTGRDDWDFLKPDLVQEVLAPAEPRGGD